MHRRDFIRSGALGLAGLPLLSPQLAAATAGDPIAWRARRREERSEGDWGIVEETASWVPRRTAVIVCDMWDLHHCKNATDRVGELAPPMNAFLTEARRRGALVIHAPSSCLAPYEDTPARRRAKDAPKASNLPAEIGTWCHKIPSEEKGTYPIDQSDGGCDTPEGPQAEWSAWLKTQGRNPDAPWLRQIDTLDIHDTDAVSDSGVEIWNLLEARVIPNVLLVGVHTNMCVLGRPFGLRRMAQNGRRVMLVRDLTDTMYNPKMWPHVDHFTGTDLIVEHIEKFVCPTTTSVSLLGGSEFRFKDDRRPRPTV